MRPRCPSRRTFLRTSALSAVAALPLWRAEELHARQDAEPPPAANDKLSVALIGCGGQGRGIAKQAMRFANVVAVCDVDAARLAQASKELGDAKPYADFRKLLDRGDIVAVHSPDRQPATLGPPLPGRLRTRAERPGGEAQGGVWGRQSYPVLLQKDSR